MKLEYDLLWKANEESIRTTLFRTRKPRVVKVDGDLFAPDRLPKEIDGYFAVMAMLKRHTFLMVTEHPKRAAEVLNGYLEGFGTPEEIALDIAGDDGGDDGGHRLSAGAGELLDGHWIWAAGKPYRDQIEHFISDCMGSYDGFDEDNPDREFEPIPWPLANVWVGTKASLQLQIDDATLGLQKVPVAKRFLILDPIKGAVSLRWLASWPDNERGSALNPSGNTNEFDGLRQFDWVIVAGGDAAVHPDWIRTLRDQCQAANVPLWFRGWGEWMPISGTTDTNALYRSLRKAREWEDQDTIDELCGRACIVESKVVDYAGVLRDILDPEAFCGGEHGCYQTFRVGANKSGSQLDGHEYHQRPTPAAEPSNA